VQQAVSRRLIGEPEYFWQKRDYDLNIRNNRQFVEKLRDIHRNPVKRGRWERPEDWEWSSFRQHAIGYEGRVEIECEWTVRKRARTARTLCPAIELPHSSQHRGLSRPRAITAASDERARVIAPFYNVVIARLTGR
jgi:hypothetical protein